MLNYAELSKVPTITMEIDGKPVEFEKIPPEQRHLTLDELNYTLNDAVQNEMDRSIVLLIALGAIGGLRRGEMAALKVGRYFHNELMLLGNDIWKLNDFYKLREYYEEHDELILIDEAIIHNRTDVLTLPKGKNIRAVGKPNCLDSIVSYCLEQRNQLNSILGRSLDGAQRLYMPMRNIILGTDYSAAKITRKWMQYQVRRNERMVEKGLEPIEIIRLHDLRHTHCTLMHEGGVPDKDTADNAGHVAYVLKNGELNNTTTKVYIHDKRMDRTNVIKFWDENIHIDWDKARRDDINAPGNKAHVNGSGHVVLKNEEMERIRNLKGRPWLSEEEEAELLCSKYKDAE